MDDYLGPTDFHGDDLGDLEWIISSTTPSLPDVHSSTILEDLELFNHLTWNPFTSELPVDSLFLTQAAVEDGSEEMGASPSYFDAGLPIPERQPFTASPPPINIALPKLQYDGRRSTTEGSESALSSYANTLCSGSPCSSSRLTFPLPCGVSEPPPYIHTYDSDKDFNRISSTVHDDLGFGRFSLRSFSECRPARRRGFHLGEEDRTRAAKVRRVGACGKCRQGKRRCRHALELKEHGVSTISRRVFHEKNRAERSSCDENIAQQSRDGNILRPSDCKQSTPQPTEDTSGASNKSRGTGQEQSPQNIRLNFASPKEPKGLPYVPKDPEKFFRRGRVFEVLWSEGAIAPCFRTFVVFRWKGCHSLCFPVDQLMTFTGVTCNERALLYAGNEPSEYDATEVRCKIRLEEENQGDLVENSTIDFGKLYTIEHNMKIRSIGQVAQMSIRIFDACATLSLEV